MDSHFRQAERVRLDSGEEDGAQDAVRASTDSTWLTYGRDGAVPAFNQRHAHFDQQRITSVPAIPWSQIISAGPPTRDYAARETPAKVDGRVADTYEMDGNIHSQRSVDLDGVPVTSSSHKNILHSNQRSTTERPNVEEDTTCSGHSAVGPAAQDSTTGTQQDRYDSASSTALPRGSAEAVPVGGRLNSAGNGQSQVKQAKQASPSGPRHRHVHGQNGQQGITEMAAPKPVQEGDRTKPQHRHTHDQNDYEPLTEMAAPEPTQEESADGWERIRHLESARDDKTTGPSTAQTKTFDYVTSLYMISNLVFFSILGTLARLGLQWLTFYPGAPVVFSNLWANFGGTFIMGFLSEDRKIFFEEWGNPDSRSQKGEKHASISSKEKAAHNKIKKQIPLYAGLTVGFCGSLTSFSTFIRDAFFALANELPTPISHPHSEPVLTTSTVPRNAGYSFMATLAVLIVSITVNLAALHFGAHVALGVEHLTPSLPFNIMRKILDPLIVFLAFGCWIGAVIMSAIPPDRPGGTLGVTSWSQETWRGQVVFALVFTPLGCLLRFFLSLKLNSIVAWMPLGTLAANVFGTAVVGMAYDLEHAPLLVAGSTMIGGGRVGCQVLQGVQDGFCGALTTVSTWVLELTTLRKKHAYFYGAVSIVACLALLVVIMGSVAWSIGFSQEVCVVEIS